MRSIREFNTTGLDYYERLDLFKTVEPIPVGDTVWDSGDCWEYPKLTVVTDDNQKIITMFWNSLYFDDKEKAETQNLIARARYAEYQAGVFN